MLHQTLLVQEVSHAHPGLVHLAETDDERLSVFVQRGKASRPHAQLLSEILSFVAASAK